MTSNLQHELARQLYAHVITPALSAIGFNDPVSRMLVLSTACKESGLQAIVQYGNGPAVSLWQMEPKTVRDTWNRLPPSHITQISSSIPHGYGPIAHSDDAHSNDVIDQLPGNLYLGAAMCRLVYYMKPFKLDPAAVHMSVSDIKPYLAHTWKIWYNSTSGAGTEAEFITSWDRFNLDSIWQENIT